MAKGRWANMWQGLGTAVRTIDEADLFTDEDERAELALRQAEADAAAQQQRIIIGAAAAVVVVLLLTQRRR